MTRWLMRLVIALVVIAVVVSLVGYSLPKSHTASRTAHFSQPPERVWATVTDFAAYPSWRKDVESVELLPEQNGRPAWREISRHGNRLTFAAETWDPPRHLVARIINWDLPFGGSWDYAISPETTGSSITITENGEVYNPIFRVVSRVMGYTATLDSYLSALAAKLSAPNAPAG